MLKYISILFCCLFLLNTGFSQAVITRKTVDGKAKNLYERARQYANANIYDKAIADIKKVIKLEPTFIDAHIQYGAYHYDLRAYEEAKKGFHQALALQADYKPTVYYMLGITEAKMKNFDAAVQNLESYLATDHKSETQRKRAQQYISRYQFAAVAYQNPVPFEPKSLGTDINSTWPEYLPSLTADGETLIFTRRYRGQEDFYISEKKDGVWSLAVPMNEINDPINNEGAQSISADGRFLVFTACNRPDGYGECDLYYSELRDGRWTPPANIGEPINGRGWESQPSLSADGRTIYFSSNKKGTLGGNDIWVSHRRSTTGWTAPYNIGDSVNTKGNEQSPFIHPDGQTLYFMSNGHPGLGKMDLYMARKKEDGTWDEPMNLGYPINTESHEGALVISLDGKTAYFASDRDFENPDTYEKENKVGQLDLYSFELYEAARPLPVTYVKAEVSDAITGKKLMADVEFADLELQKTHTKSSTDAKGEFLVVLPMGKNYGLSVSKEGYLFHSENFALKSGNSLEEPHILKIKLVPIPEPVVETTAANEPKDKTPVVVATPIVLRNIFFETGSAELQKESISELQQLQKLLTDHPTMRIQINGHTDNVGSVTDNLTLSSNRAKAVQNWLIEQGIKASRLKYKGYGETQAIDTNDTELGRQNNRRTEFVVL